MNKVIIAGIVIVILGLISFLAIGFVNNTNQILEERNKVSAELEKLKESAVAFTPGELQSRIEVGERHSVSGYFTLPAKYEDKITNIDWIFSNKLKSKN